MTIEAPDSVGLPLGCSRSRSIRRGLNPAEFLHFMGREFSFALLAMDPSKRQIGLRG